MPVSAIADCNRVNQAIASRYSELVDQGLLHLPHRSGSQPDGSGRVVGSTSPPDPGGSLIMLIVKVIKPLVSTNRIPDFEHKHLQVVQDGSTKKVAVDAVGAKPGDWVICVRRSAAREAAGSSRIPVISPSWGSSITGNRTLRRRRLLLHPPVPAHPQEASPADGDHAGDGHVDCTYRVAGLDHMHLRILRNNKGKKLVAVDPVGAREGNAGVHRQRFGGTAYLP